MNIQFKGPVFPDPASAALSCRMGGRILKNLSGLARFALPGYAAYAPR